MLRTTGSIWLLPEQDGNWQAGMFPNVSYAFLPRPQFVPFHAHLPIGGCSVRRDTPTLLNRFLPGYPYIYSQTAYGITAAGNRNTGYFSPWPHSFAGAPFIFPGSGEEQISVEAVYQNPLQPAAGQGGHGEMNFPAQTFPYPRPHPGWMHLMKPPSGFQTLLNSFKTQDGTLDIKKMIDTAGQMAYAVNQFQSLVKGLGSIFKIKGTPV